MLVQWYASICLVLGCFFVLGSDDRPGVWHLVGIALWPLSLVILFFLKVRKGVTG